jgi:hypothetical protein
MKKMIIATAVIVWFFSIPVWGQIDSLNRQDVVVDTLQQDFGLFRNDDILKISLRFDITEFTRKKPKEDLDAILTYHISEKDSINKTVRLKSRGEMRNEYCSFPPIKMNFKDSGFEKSDLNHIKTIKMVTHCQYGNEEYLFKEYLIYKLYNVLTDTSFRVRLLNIEYINTRKAGKPIKTYAFLIEPEEMLAERVKSVPVKSVNLTQKNIVPEMMDRLAIFNFMIGNTDWSVPNLHNCKVLSSLSFGNSGLGLVVPYDFDYSGLVNADYAIPYEGLGLSSVRERRYVGICRSEETFINALKEFTEKKEDFYRVINEFPLLGEKTKKEMIKYLDSFYLLFDKRNTIISNILDGCSRF